MESAISSSFNCELCHKNFSQKSTLNRHVREQHLQPDLYQCKQCGLRFSKKYNLQMHMTNIHIKNLQKTTKQLTCSQYKENLTKRNNKKQHKSFNTDLNTISNRKEQDVLEPDAQTLAKTVLNELKQLQRELQPMEADEENLTTLAATEIGIKKNIIVKDNLYPSGHFKQLKIQTIKRLDGFTYLICEFCKKEFKKSYNFLRHRRIHTKVRPFICVLCKKSFPTTAELKTHCFIHRLHERFGFFRKYYKCPKCNEAFSSRHQLDKHLSSSSFCCQVSFKCPQCVRTFKSLRTLLSHRHGKEDQELQLLKKILPAPELVSEEIPFANTFYECKFCGLPLSDKIVLKQHEQRHTNLFKYQCLECQRTYATQVALKMHTKTHLCYTNFKCLYCKKTFKRKQNCRRHMMTHLKLLINTKEQKENLEIFPTFIENEEKQQIQNSQMIIIKANKAKTIPTDQESHNTNNEYKYKCSKCDKSFRYSAWLKKHFNYKHSSEQPYECEKCLRKFRSKQSLKNHLLVHTTQRLKLTCQVCGRLYASSKSLKLHLRIHTQEKPFKCDKCYKQFRTSGHLIQHCKSNHKD